MHRCFTGYRFPQLRRELGCAARSRVERLYYVEANKNTYLSVFDEVCGSEY